jgi:hypothetical protein
MRSGSQATLADYHLPLLDEPIPPTMGRYQHQHTRAWAERVAAYDTASAANAAS